MVGCQGQWGCGTWGRVVMAENGVGIQKSLQCGIFCVDFLVLAKVVD